MKQHLGLNANQSTNPVSTDQWMWLCALAYWQLLLMRDEVEWFRPAWFPAKSASERSYLTPGQVQRGTLRFLMLLGTPTRSLRPAGKGRGRPKGYSPPHRKRYPIVKKAKSPPKQAVLSL